MTETHLGAGQPDKEIGAGTIVMVSRGLGTLSRALMGSVSESVVRHAHCPVFLVRGDDGGP